MRAQSLVSLLAVASLVFGATVPNPTPAPDSLSNADRFARGLAPAWPAALKRVPHNTAPRRLRRTTVNNPSPTVTTYDTAPTSVLTDRTYIRDNSVFQDDQFYVVNFPVPITIYNRTQTRAYVSCNGQLSVPNTALPKYDYFTKWTMFFFWEDTVILQRNAAGNTNFGIYYDTNTITTGSIVVQELTVPSRNEFIITPPFTRPLVPVFGPSNTTRLYISDNGVSSTVGAQGPDNRFMQWTFDQPVVSRQTNRYGYQYQHLRRVRFYAMSEPCLLSPYVHLTPSSPNVTGVRQNTSARERTHSELKDADATHGAKDQMHGSLADL
ncbi:hypothetical protein BKA62DRAFT_675645, partial [Auriculariales sp. MPI-PUGE-AT-0066]